MKIFNRKTLIFLFAVMLLLPPVLQLRGEAIADYVPTGTVTVALPSNIMSLAPPFNPGWIGQACNWQIFDALCYRDPDTMKVVPQLAESWLLIDDNTWEFKLRKNVRFHNGEIFNAESVKFIFDGYFDKKQNFTGRGLISRVIDRVDRVDDYRVRFTTKKPFPYLPDLLTAIFVVPHSYVTEVGWEAFGKKPVGTGPFKFVEWVKGQRLILEANENYWKFTPAVKTLVLRPIPEPATQIAELLSGGVDIIFKIPPDQMPIIKKSKKVQAITGPGLRTVFLMLDANGRSGESPMKNIKLRKAVGHAINVEAIMEHIMGGMASRANTGLNPDVFGADSSISPPVYDPQMAKKLIAEAGYSDGFSMTLNAGAGSIISADQIMLAVAGQLTKVGIKVKTRFIEDVGTFTKEMHASKLKDSILMSWGYGGIFDADMFHSWLFVEGSPYTYAWDDKLTKMIKTAGSTMDTKKRRELYTQIQQHIKDNVYLVPMYAQNYTIGVSNRINYKHCTDERARLFDITWKK